ncbi:VirB4 family type IV secretion/conjugal transfer ATPase [Acinetobacter variabilis]|uniref:VirB4 family type IV secretion/conjugal transfer ATPase n=1 Tax=Acinetobacter variabilis TaxID=70346 RepID=UPI0028AE9310|nr:VirB4 family type IV secretion/conjugal transfer ATPase [Acinetobacter variabilis]
MKKGLLDFRKDFSNAKYIPFSYHLTDSIVSLKDQEFIAVIKVSGKSHQTTDERDIYRWIENLNTISRTFASENIEFYSHIIRRDMAAYPEGEYEGYFARELNEKYRADYLDLSKGSLKVNELYFTIVYNPFGRGALSSVRRKAISSYDAVKDIQLDSIKELDAAVDKMLMALSDYDCQLLTTYTEKNEKSGREVCFSAPMEVMAYILNGRTIRVPLTNLRFASTICHAKLKFSKRGEVGVRTYLNESEYVGMVEIYDYDKKTFPGQIDYLLESEFSFVMTNSFSCISNRAADGFLKNHIKFMKETGDASKTQIEMMEQARDDLKSGLFTMGMHHCTVQVWSENLKKLNACLDSITNDLSQHGLVMKQLTKALEPGFYAQLPGNARLRPRPKPVTSYNFWCFSSFHNFRTGKISGNPWGSAITAFKTDSKTPFYLNFHDSPVNRDSYGSRPTGHAGIFGKTGAGKTLLLAFILAMMQKYKTKGIIFDKDRGLENAVRAMGGVYNPVLWGEKTGWNPFQMEPTLENITFLKEWVADLCASGTNYMLKESDKRIISEAVDTVMKVAEKSKRGLSTLEQMLPHGDEEKVTVRKLLYPWIHGDYAWVFNNATDNLQLNEGYFGFDTTSFCDKEQVRIPILRYLTHRGDEMIDGKPFVYVFEECWYFCKDPFFIKLIQDKLKTIRKDNGIVVFSTQEPNDVLGSEIGKTFGASLATVLALRNDNANAEDYRKLNFTDLEISTIRNMAETDRRLIIKQGRVSSIARFDLGNYKDEMNILSGSSDKADILLECINEAGPEIEDWLPFYYERMRKELRA